MRAASLLPENVQAKIAQALALVRADRALQLAQRPVRVVEQDIAMLRDELKAVKLEREEARATAEHFRRELNSIVDGARAFSATSVVGANAKVYDDSGARHSDASFWWLIAVILVSALLAGLTIYGVVLAFDAPLGTTEQIIQVGLAKLMVFSVLSFAVLFCSRVYRAHKHNQTLYEHRANALRSFLAFVNATEDKRTRDIILGHAANAAFASRASGFDVTSQESLTASIPGLDALTGAASPNS